jgi:hypothetical protein
MPASEPVLSAAYQVPGVCACCGQPARSRVTARAVIRIGSGSAHYAGFGMPYCTRCAWHARFAAAQARPWSVATQVGAMAGGFAGAVGALSLLRVFALAGAGWTIAAICVGAIAGICAGIGLLLGVRRGLGALVSACAHRSQCSAEGAAVTIRRDQRGYFVCRCSDPRFAELLVRLNPQPAPVRPPLASVLRDMDPVFAAHVFARRV